MEDKFINSIKVLEYADLKEHQEKRMMELEKKFNEEFGTTYYFMVMEQNR